MKGALTLEQMQFLESKGLSLSDAIAFARLGEKRSTGADRQARYRRRQKGVTTDDTPSSVTSDVTRDASPPPIEDHTPPVSSDEETKPARKTKKALACKPDDVTASTWDDFVEHRKRKGAPLTVTALEGIREEADKAKWPMEAALRKTMARGWQGFEAEWVKDEKPRHHDPGGGDDLARRILARQAAESPANAS